MRRHANRQILVVKDDDLRLEQDVAHDLDALAGVGLHGAEAICKINLSASLSNLANQKHMRGKKLTAAAVIQLDKVHQAARNRRHV